jgi:lysophospholipase L1-like esterase
MSIRKPFQTKAMLPGGQTVKAEVNDVSGVIKLSAGAYDNAQKLLRCAKSGLDPHADDAGLTVTVGAADGATQIAGSVLIEPDDTRVVPSRPAARGTGWPGPLFTFQKHTDYAAPGVAPDLVCITSRNTFSTDADDFEVLAKGDGIESFIWVGGNKAAVTLPATGSLYLVRVQIAGGKKLREVQIESAGGFGGIRQSPVQSFSRPLSESLRLMVIGDSITEGAAATFTTRAYANRLAGKLGAYIGGVDGVGGTGYTATFSGTRKAIPERIAGWVASEPVDVCIWAAGINDDPTVPGYSDAILSSLNTVKAHNPNVLNIVFGPFQPRSLATVLPTNAIIAQAARSAGAIYIDNVTQDEITGTGRVGTTASDGNSDWVVSADGVHPTDSGHAYIADWRFAAILRALSA